MKQYKRFEVYDKENNYQGFFLANEEHLAKARAEQLNGYYTEGKGIWGD